VVTARRAAASFPGKRETKFRGLNRSGLDQIKLNQINGQAIRASGFRTAPRPAPSLPGTTPGQIFQYFGLMIDSYREYYDSWIWQLQSGYRKRQGGNIFLNKPGRIKPGRVRLFQ
jgi:hypothetical protein